MAEEIIKIEDFKFKEGQVASRELTRKFGREEDYAEIHVLSLNDQVLASDFNFINLLNDKNTLEVGSSVYLPDLSRYLKKESLVFVKWSIICLQHLKMILMMA